MNDSRESTWTEKFRSLVLLGVFVVLIRSFLFEPFVIPSGSMLETLQIGDHLLATKYDYGLRIPLTNIHLTNGSAPERGDIVIFRFPQDPSEQYIKRVIGIPGDTIAIRNKQLYRNGEAVKEDYIRFSDPDRMIAPRDNFGPVTVPDGKLFMMGDNRDDSYDSRFWGFLDQSELTAKPHFILWSVEDFPTMRWSRTGKSVSR